MADSVCYKVFRKHKGRLISALADGLARTDYSLGLWSIGALQEHKLHPLAFNSVESAARFSSFIGNAVIARCLGRGYCWLPTYRLVIENRFYVNGIPDEFEELRVSEKPWPIGTVMFEQIKPVQLIDL